MNPSVKKLLTFLGVEILYILLVYLTGLNWFYFGTLAIADHFYWNYINWTFWKPREVKEKKKEDINSPKDWGNAVAFAVIGATLIHTFIIQPFTIPTSSMEKSMLVGDYLLVSKLNYGPVVPNTPLSIPFMHNTLPGGTSKSYSDAVQLGYNRLPGYSSVQNNDIVVFNYPEDKLQKNMPFDKKTHYVKRCLGIAGDSLEIKDQAVFVNGKEQPLPDRSKGQTSYVATFKNAVNPVGFLDFGITDFKPVARAKKFLLQLNDETYNKIKNYSSLASLEKAPLDPSQRGTFMFPNDKDRGWSVDNFGPIYIPEAGATVALNSESLPFYKRIINDYEGNELKVDGEKIYINGELADSYTFQMNYYWMMGDNRHNSLDSRFWGFVPENHIVGKPILTWLSMDPNKSIGDGKIRWDRMFTFYHGEGPAKSYLIHFIVLVVLIQALIQYRKRKNKKAA